MVRHAKMKQKTSKTTALNVHVTSARLDDSTKDDEERRLEICTRGNGKGKEKAIELDGEDEEEITAQADGGRTVAHLEDADNDDNDEEGSEGSSSEAEPTVANEPSASSKKPAAWTDADDVTVAAGVLLKGPSRLRKLHQAVDEDVISAANSRASNLIQSGPRNIVKAKKHDLDLLSETPTTRLRTRTTYLRRSSNHVFADTRRKGKKGEVKLPKDTFSIERLRDVNQATQNSGNGEVRVESFHPNPAASTLCVATAEYDYSTSMDIFRLR
ncbi:hypothetical protein D9611_000835 [Ephemerocybe angulata]|uniref:Uncharacterized protein n=1 Tax=Ephemerocybe angulata TaxID=980116 RepID=A0A8H5F792_9AGAR|nr:hypothetical protein D9611_000835 [Tulosesus angulatus]